MVKDDQRAIIVFGMARSGTTVFTHVLGQHHKIHLFHNVYNYENNFVFNNNWEKMEEVLSQFPSKRVVFKRPWSESLVDFYKEHFPNASYLAMVKPFEMINESWKKSTWTRAIWDHTDEQRKEKYDKHMAFLDSYRDMNFKLVDYTNFVSEPDRVMDSVCQFLGILSYRQIGKVYKPAFDTSFVKPGGDWSFLKN